MKRAPLAGILFGYAVLAALVQAHCTDLLSSDGECYLRIAVTTAHGDFRHAVFGHWSPLGSWLTVPLVAGGMVPRHAFRVMIGLWGAAAVVGAWRLAGRFGSSGAWRIAATACAAVLAAEFSAEHRVDLLLAALLLFYLDAVMDERLLTSRRWAAGVGALGGVAYLAKLYALPFFAVHYTLMVLAQGWVARGQGAGGSQQSVGRASLHAEPSSGSAPAGRCSSLGVPHPSPLPRGEGMQKRPLWRAMAVAWLAGVAAFALVAAPWVAVLSLKHGRLTVGTAAAQTYAQCGPGAGDTRPWATTGLRKPPDHAYNVWQDAELDLPVSTKPASPFRGREAFAEQMRTVWRNLGAMRMHFAGLDRFRLGLAAIALTPLAFLLTLRRREAAFRHLAAAATIAVFCGGYSFIYADEERFFWFPFLLAPPIAFHYVAVAARAARRLMPRTSARRAQLLGAALGLLAAASFADRSCAYLRELFGSPPPGREHRLVAQRLAAWGIQGPLAAMGPPHGPHTAWHDGLHAAYYLNAQYAGMPAAQTPDRIVAEMRRRGSQDAPRVGRAAPGGRPPRRARSETGRHHPRREPDGAEGGRSGLRTPGRALTSGGCLGRRGGRGSRWGCRSGGRR